MSSAAVTILQLVAMLTWACITGTPKRFVHPMHFDYVPDEATLLNLLSSISGLSFAPGLLDVLQSDDPPSIDFFMSLPTQWYKVWGIYMLVLVKPGHQPRIYVGSGTNSLSGVSSRLKNYDNHQILPRWVDYSLKNGFIIAHKGLLCWAPIPMSNKPRTRALFLGLEAAFSYAFWCFYSHALGLDLLDLCQWDPASLPYSGLSSHSPLMEAAMGEHDFTPEQLAAHEAEFHERRQTYMVEWRAENKAKDPEKYLANAREQRKKQYTKDPAACMANDRRCAERAVEEKRH